MVRAIGQVSGAGSWPGRSGAASAANGQISRSAQATASISVPQPAVFKVRETDLPKGSEKKILFRLKNFF